MQKFPTSPMRFTARNDYAFKKLFGTEENKDIMVEFLSLVTHLSQDDFDDVRIDNNEQIPRFYNDKTGRLDIKIRLNDGRKIDVEMQNTYFDYYPKRSVFYCSKMIHEHFFSGLQYMDLKKCIAINVLNSLFKLSRKVHSVYQIRESEEQTLLDELLEIHFLDLTKLPKENLTSLEKWLMFIKTDSKEKRRMLAQGNPVMTKANKVMDIFYLDEQERKRYEAAWEYESDRLSMINESERKGLERGLAEGSRQAKLETARNLRAMGLSSKNIMQATGLTVQEVEAIALS
ncbi:PD-(D/E)XK nuclease family transposase [Treponema vincentii]|nr:Rpn family recombination-promoting nuclease/putative transposase [Treponema vincentii]UTC46203.1 PD-(D/E)XK nuclease family transposase [Treponema vincentii]